MRCPGCGKELKIEAKSCPNCNRLLVVSARDRLYSQSTESYAGVRHQQGRVQVDQDFNEEIKVTTESEEKIEDEVDAQSKAGHKPIRTEHGSSNDSPYAHVLKPHSTIDVKGLGSKMAGSSYVPAIRHEIAAADESESTQRLQCTNCDSEIEKSDKFCRTCGTRITS